MFDRSIVYFRNRVLRLYIGSVIPPFNSEVNLPSDSTLFDLHTRVHRGTFNLTDRPSSYGFRLCPLRREYLPLRSCPTISDRRLEPFLLIATSLSCAAWFSRTARGTSN